MTQTSGAGPSERAANLGLFILSGAILALEVLHVRVLSVQMWYHHAYVVVTMAMLGFAASGTVVTLRPGLARGDTRTTLAWLSVLFGVAVTAGHALLTRTADAVTTVSAGGEFGALALAYAILMLPYFLGGLVITIALSSTAGISTRYFVNLVGSALGVWLFIAAIGPLAAERLLVLCAAAGPLAALCFAGRRGIPAAAAAIALLAAGALFVKADDLLEIRLGAGKRRHVGGELIDQRWTPLCRLDLYADTPVDPKAIHILQDGGAGTYMYRDEDWIPPSPLDPHTVAYVPHINRMQRDLEGSRPKVLVIGVGGGTDLRIAGSYGARSVRGIEINAETVRLIEKDYADFTGRLLERPGVSVTVGEGRSTLRRLDEKFDLIQIAGADTYTAGMASSFVLSESYLYTVEAIRDFFDHLNPGGTLGVMRFLDEPDRETVRLFGMALLELRSRGVERPSAHAAVIGKGFGAGTVFSLAPLSPQDVALFSRAQTESSGQYTVIYVPGLERDNAFTRLARAIDEGKEEEFFASYHVDVRPVTDDSPFYFNFHHVWDSATEEVSAYAKYMDSRIPVAPSILRNLLLQTTLLVLVLVLLPLFVLRRKGLEGGGTARHLAFFLAVGAGFMLLEISSIQRLALFLGHPTYSLTVVLFSFLFFAGLGSFFAGRFVRDESRGMKRALAVLCALIVAFTLGLEPLTRALLHLPLEGRIAAAIAVLAPINFVMGMPFPLALARLRASRPELVAWAIGANGGASVISSVLAAILAMEAGFFAVGVCALACYLVALLASAPASSTPAGRGSIASSVAP